MRKDNIEMAAIIQDLEKNVGEYKQKIEASDHKIWQITNQFNQAKKKLTAQQKDLDELKIKDPYQLLRKNINSNIVDELKADVEKKSQEINQLNNANQMKDKKINELERRLKELATENQEQIAKFEKERNQLKERFQEKSEELMNLQTSYYSDNIRNKRSKPTFVRNEIETNKENDFENKFQQKSNLEKEPEVSEQYFYEQSTNPQAQTIKVQTVSKKDVQNIGSELKYRFRQQLIQLKDLDQYIFNEGVLFIPEGLEEKHVILQSIYENLQKYLNKNQFLIFYIRYPFNLGTENALKLSRYLVEDSDEQFVIVKMEASSPVARVRSILRNLLNNYELFLQEDTIVYEINQYLSRLKNTIVDYIIKEKGSKGISGDYCLQEHFMDALTYVDVQLTPRQIDFILQKNYELTNDLSKFQYQSILDMIITKKKKN